MATKLPDDILELSRQCIECDGPGCHQIAPRKKCSRCKAWWYCSVECQKRDWKSHKSLCGSIVKRKEYLEAQNEKAATFVEPINTECGICLEEDISDRRVIVPGCRHGFCYRCLLDWRESYELDDEDDSTYCPLCRTLIKQGVEFDILHRAKFYGDRAAREGISEEEKTENLCIAFAELDKLFSAPYQAEMLRPLLAKADILRTVKQTRQALDILEKVEEMDRESVRNRERLFSLGEICSSPNCDQATRNRALEEMQKLGDSRPLFRIGDQEEIFRIMRTKTQLAEVKADLGEFQEGLDILNGFLKEYGSVKADSADDEKLTIRLANAKFRCSHGAGNFEDVIRSGEIEIHQLARTLPGPYKFVALAQRDTGNVEAAKTTIKRALLHVVFWDDEYTQDDFVELYEELASE